MSYSDDRILLWLSGAALGGVLLTSAPAVAQEPAHCASTVATASRAPAEREIRLLVDCHSGPEVLARVWSRQPDPSPALLEPLVISSAMLRDVRLYRSVKAVAENPARSSEARLGALRLLFSYHSPDLLPSRAELVKPRIVGLASESMMTTAPRTRRNDSAPVATSVRGEVQDIIARIARAETDPVVKEAALRLRQDLAHRDPARTPVAQGAISIKAGCGSSVDVESNENILLRLRIEVLETVFDKTLAIAPASGNAPGRLPLSLPEGVVVVSFGGRELARLTDRKAPCPPGVR